MIAFGAMSGTSTDGVDVAAVQVDPVNGEMRYLGATSTRFPADLRRDLLALQEIPPRLEPGVDPLAMMLQARLQLTQAYISTAQDLLSLLGLSVTDVHVLGAHGQTLRHRPDLGYTYQMLDGALLANHLGIHVVCDFRSKDVALGGQGAPLVPAFHQAWLNGRGLFDRTAVLNLGGFSNLTVLNGRGKEVTGGDCGPANSLMDQYALKVFNQEMDTDGDIAARGDPDQRLLDLFLSHPFFSQSWPKSTGRDDFGWGWFTSCLQRVGHVDPEDVMATLLALTVSAVKTCLPVGVEQVYLCGGGARNNTLVAQLACECSPLDFLPIENLGLPAQAVEAAAFAWLGGQYLLKRPGSCASVTGASRSAVLGALHLPN